MRVLQGLLCELQKLLCFSEEPISANSKRDLLLAKHMRCCLHLCDSTFKIGGKMLHNSSWDWIRKCEINSCTGTRICAGGAPDAEQKFLQPGRDA